MNGLPFAGLREARCTPCATAALERQEAEHGVQVVHRAPADELGLTPCCFSLLARLPAWHRLSTDPSLVTCGPGWRRGSAVNNLNVYCVRCNGSGIRPGTADQPCGLCKGGVLGVVLAQDLMAVVQESLTNVGVQVRPGPRTEEML